MSATLRLTDRSDLSAVHAIVEEAYAPYIVRIGRKPQPMLDNYIEMITEGRVYVAERDAIVLGILVLVPQTDALLLDNVAVAPEAQGSGIGRKMLEFAEKMAIDAGYDSIRLYTNEAMTENIALYTRFGYVETHRIEEKGLRRVYMSKAVGAA